LPKGGFIFLEVKFSMVKEKFTFDSELLEKIKGFLAYQEGMRLYEIAGEAAELGPCLEIGSYCGKSAIFLGTACREKGGTLFSIDHHRGSEEQQPGEEYFDPELYDAKCGKVDTFALFRRTLEETNLAETVVPIVSRSDVAARSWATPLGLVFIDGGHAYETVYRDYLAWVGHIIQGGYLIIHDIYPNPDDGGQAPYQVYQMAVSSGLFEELPMTGSLGVLRRLQAGDRSVS
jgi:predicted O-methyltransferase YrrM